MSRAGEGATPALSGAAALAATALGGGCLSLPYAVGALGVRRGPQRRATAPLRRLTEPGPAAAGRWWAASGPWSSRRWRTA